MGSAATRWSGRPKPQRPPLVATDEARGTWPEVDAALAPGPSSTRSPGSAPSLRRHDIAAALLVDPVNIRYASGTSIMPVWTLHAIDRYLLVPADG